MTKMILTLLVLVLFFVVTAINVLGAVTQSGVEKTPGPSNYSVGSDVTVTITGAASDKGDPCFYEWVGEEGALLENDTVCTIPSSSPFQIFQSHTVLAGEAPQINLSGRLYVNDVFISQAFYNTTSTGGVSTLDIVDVETTTDIFVGKTAGIKGVIKNQGKLVGYADVCLDILDENNEPLQHIGCKKSEVDGQFFFSERCDGTNWCTEGVSFIVDIDVSCPKNSSSYVSCINEDGDELDFANGGSSKAFTVVDIADKFIIKKWIDAAELVQPGMFVFNEFTSKAQMRKNPADAGGYLTQQDIDWGGFNNTNTSFTILQNGEAFLTAGNTFTIGFIINNTFPDEIEFDVFECTLDDDNKSQEIFPLDPITKQRFGSEVIAHLFAKPSSDEGLVQKFTPPLLLAFDFVGGNDFDVQCKIKLHDFDQEITPESDEFHLFGEVEGTDFVPIIDIKNLTTSAFNTKQDACTQINVTINYDYFGAIEQEFILEYHFEQTDIDVIVKTIKRLTKPDTGKNNNITDTFFLPFFEVSGEAEVFVEILNQDDIIVGFGDTEPHNTFNITADLSDSCRYRDDANQFLQARATRALEGINSSAGTFDFSIDVPDSATTTVTVSGTGKTGQGRTLNRDLNIKCQVDNHPSTLTEFKVFSTDTFSFTKSINTGLSNAVYTMSCTAIDRYFGEDAVQATDNFQIRVVAPTGGGGGVAAGSSATQGFPSKVIELAEEIIAIPKDIAIVLGQSLMDLIRPIFALINKFPIIFAISIILTLIVGNQIYTDIKKKKLNKDE